MPDTPALRKSSRGQVSTPAASRDVIEAENLPNLHSFAPREVAGELALLDAGLLRLIKTSELEDGVWMKKDKKETMAPNIMAMVRSFNRIALLVPTEILAEETAHGRGKVISTFIKIAQECHRHGNYNSLKAVLAGLQSTPIFRLDKSWKELSCKRKRKFDTLTAVMHEDNNWGPYRREIEEKIDSNSPFIPFLGVFLTTTAYQQTAQAKLRANSMSMASGKPEETAAKMYETYHLLEAITVRERLDKLREDSITQDETDGGISPIPHHISAPHLPSLFGTPPTLRANRSQETLYPMETPYRPGSMPTGQAHKRSLDERSPVKDTRREHSKVKCNVEVIANGSAKRSKVNGSVVERSKCNGLEASKSGEGAEGMLPNGGGSKKMNTTPSKSSPQISVRPVNGCCFGEAAPVEVIGSQPVEQVSGKAGKSQNKDPGLKRRLFAGNKQSFQQCRVASDLEQCAVSPLAEFKAAPSGNSSQAYLAGATNDGSGSNRIKNGGGKSQSPKQLSLISGHDPTIKVSSYEKTPDNTRISACSSGAKADKKTSRKMSATDSLTDKKQQKLVKEKRKKWQAKNREVSVSVGWASTSSVTTTISGSLECLLDAVDTEMPSIRKERVQSIPRSPSLTALCSFDMSGQAEGRDSNPCTSDYVDASLCDPCLQREGPCSTESSDGLLSQSPNAALLRRSCNDLTHREPMGGAGGTSSTVELRGRGGHDSEMSGEEEENFESCESVSSVESTANSTFLSRLPSFRKHRRNSSHPNFSFHKDSNHKNKVPGNASTPSITEPHHHHSNLQQKISSFLKHPLHSPSRRQDPIVSLLRAARMERSSDPGDVLHQYQFQSLGCCAQIDSCAILRRVLTEKPHNTEAVNYKLSYQREPM